MRRSGAVCTEIYGNLLSDLQHLPPWIRLHIGGPAGKQLVYRAYWGKHTYLHTIVRTCACAYVCVCVFVYVYHNMRCDWRTGLPVFLFCGIAGLVVVSLLGLSHLQQIQIPRSCAPRHFHLLTTIAALDTHDSGISVA